MIFLIFIITLSICIYDLCKNKNIFSPIFIYNFMWFITLGLYEIKISSLQQDLTNRTLMIFLIAILSYNFVMFAYRIKEKFYEKKEKKKKESNKARAMIDRFFKVDIEKRVNIAKIIVILIFVLEVIYSKGVPIIWKIMGDSKTYFDFGITSLNGAWYGLLICLGAYSLATKRKDSIIYLIIGILILSRQVILSIIIEALVIYLLKNKISKKQIILVIIIAFICFFGFNILGNIRSEGMSNIENVFMAKEEYNKLPTSVKWAYSYMTFSLGNFNNLTKITDGGIANGYYTLSEILPNVILNSLNIENNNEINYLVSPNFTVSTYLPSVYLDFGVYGIIILNMIIAIIGIILYKKLYCYNSIKNRLYYSIFLHNILFLFFINMFTYLPIIIQFLYVFIIFTEKEKVSEANS